MSFSSDTDYTEEFSIPRFEDLSNQTDDDISQLVVNGQQMLNEYGGEFNGRRNNQQNNRIISYETETNTDCCKNGCGCPIF